MRSLLKITLILNITICILLINYLKAQENITQFIKTIEVIKKYNFQHKITKGESTLNPFGFNSKHPLYYFELYKDKKISIYQLDEKNMLLQKYPYDSSYILRGRIYSLTGLDSLLSYSETHHDALDGYSQLYLRSNKIDLLLDSIYNSDKHIHSGFSTDRKYLLVNSLNTLSDYYNPTQDDRIMVYDLSGIEKGEIKKEHIPCDNCSDSYLINDKLFFTIGRKDGYGGFSNKDIYMAPWGNIKDTVKVASNTGIIAISPDGKYILGVRFFDRQQNTCVIIDVEKKQYQMLIGRDYYKHKAFYSYHEQKFAFDFDGWLVYIGFPESYPFNALNWRNEEIPDWTEDIWKQLQHPPLE